MKNLHLHKFITRKNPDAQIPATLPQAVDTLRRIDKAHTSEHFGECSAYAQSERATNRKARQDLVALFPELAQA